MLESSPWFPLRPEFTDADFYLIARLRPQGLESTCPGVRGAMERSENSCTVGAAASQAQHGACNLHSKLCCVPFLPPHRWRTGPPRAEKSDPEPSLCL